MKIAELALKGNGATRNLRATDLDHRLTVLFGPPGTGKSTIAGFVGHALYGKQSAAEPASHRDEIGEAAGDLVVVDDGHRYRLRRYTDVAPPGRLTVSSLDGAPVDRHTVEKLVSGISPRLLQSLYVVDFRAGTHTDWLLSAQFAREFRAALDARHDATHVANGFDNQGGSHATRHVAQLLQRKEELARMLEERLASERRRSSEIEAQLADYATIDAERQQTVEELRRRLRASQAELAEVETRLRYHNIDELVDRERTTVEPTDLNPRLEELDEQIERWRATLTELEQREGAVRGRLARLHPDDSAPELQLIDEQRCLRVVERLVADLEGEIARLAGSTPSRGCVCSDAHARLVPLVETMRGQTTRLGEIHRHQQLALEYQQLERELQHLSRSRAELGQQLEHLLDRRQTLLRATRPARRSGGTQTHRNGQAETSKQHGSDDQLQTVASRLEKQVADLAAQLARAEHELRDLARRREDLSRQRSELFSGESIDQIRAELVRIQRQIDNQAITFSEASAGPATDSERASDYLAHLTNGRLTELRLAGPQQTALVVTATADEVPLESLSTIDRNLVHLALVLALVGACQQRGIQLPLVLDEPFHELDDRQAVVVAGVLDDFSRRKGQVLVCTDRQAATDRLRALGARVCTTAELRADDLPEPAEAIAVKAPVAALDSDRQSVAVRPSLFQPLEGTALDTDDPIARFPALGRDTEAAFQPLGIRCVGDLLAADPEQVARDLARPQISADVVRLWQSHQALLCFVPRLTLDDAQVLTAVGVTGPEELANEEGRALDERIGDYLRSERGERFRERDYQFNRERGRDWIRSARQNRARWRGSDVWQRCQKRRQAAAKRMRKTGPSQQNSKSESARRSSRLTTASPVVDGPSIGPKTAARLEKAGIRTVSELLAADPVDTARRLKARHIKADTIATWQRQAKLMCQVPQLRAHDVQILVGCGLSSVEQIAELRPEDLLTRVGPFCNTKEGERILRGADTPDLEEVTRWIAWAGKRRSLEAA